MRYWWPAHLLTDSLQASATANPGADCKQFLRPVFDILLTHDTSGSPLLGITSEFILFTFISGFGANVTATTSDNSHNLRLPKRCSATPATQAERYECILLYFAAVNRPVGRCRAGTQVSTTDRGQAAGTCGYKRCFTCIRVVFQARDCFKSLEECPSSGSCVTRSHLSAICACK